MKGQKTLFSSASEEWSTPQDLFDRLHACFKFSVDLAASDDNHKVACYYTKENSALNQDWNGYTGFCNPPYGKAIHDFVEKAHYSQGIFVFLLPAREMLETYETSDFRYCKYLTYESYEKSLSDKEQK